MGGRDRETKEGRTNCPMMAAYIVVDLNTNQHPVCTDYRHPLSDELYYTGTFITKYTGFYKQMTDYI